MTRRSKRPASERPALTASQTTEVRIPLFGLHCQSCALRIESRLRRAEGVQSARLSVAAEHAIVQLKDVHGSLPRLLRVIEEAGYDPRVTRAHIPLPALSAGSPAIEALQRELNATPGITHARIEQPGRVLVADFLPGTIDVNSIRAIVHRFGYATSHPIPPVRSRVENKIRLPVLHFVVALLLALAATMLSAPMLSLDTPGIPDSVARGLRNAVEKILPAAFFLPSRLLETALLVFGVAGIVLAAKEWIRAGVRAISARIVDSNSISAAAVLFLFVAAVGSAVRSVLYGDITSLVAIGIPTMLWMISLINAVRLVEKKLRFPLTDVAERYRVKQNQRHFNFGGLLRWSSLILGTFPLILAIWFVFGPKPSFGIAVIAATAFLAAFCADLAANVALVPFEQARNILNGLNTRFADRESMLRLSAVKVLAVHDDGVITTGRPEVSDFVFLNGASQQDLLLAAGGVAVASEQRDFQAIARRAEQVSGFRRAKIQDKSVSAVAGEIGSKKVMLGAIEQVAAAGVDTSPIQEEAQRFHDEGKSVFALTVDSRLIGAVATKENVIPRVDELVQRLAHKGVRVHLITGAAQTTADARARAAGIDSFSAGISSETEAAEISILRRSHGAVAYVRRGREPRAAFARADVSIALLDEDGDSDADLEISSGTLENVVRSVEVSKEAVDRTRKLRTWAMAVQIVIAAVGIQLLYPVSGKLVLPLFIVSAVLLALVVLNRSGRKWAAQSPAG